MTTIRVTDARAQFTHLISTAQTEAVFLERRGKVEAVVVSPGQYERMMDALEEAEDLEAYDASLADEGPSIPWEQVKTDLGWE
ncbi:MAG: type II toxin-antitoxin system Phd/YefM family antitoxin [Pseudolysinimonas sp.]